MHQLINSIVVSKQFCTNALIRLTCAAAITEITRAVALYLVTLAPICDADLVQSLMPSSYGSFFVTLAWLVISATHDLFSKLLPWADRHILCPQTACFLFSNYTAHKSAHNSAPCEPLATLFWHLPCADVCRASTFFWGACTQSTVLMSSFFSNYLYTHKCI